MTTTKILPAVRLVEITKELHSLSLDGLEGAPFYATMAMRMRLHRERERIFREQERKAKREQAKRQKQKRKLIQLKDGKQERYQSGTGATADDTTGATANAVGSNKEPRG